MLDRYYWLLEKRILVFQFSGIFTYEEMLKYTEQVVCLIREAGKPPRPPVHLIADTLGTTDFDPAARNLRNMMPIARMLYREPMLGWILNIDDKPLHIVRFIANTNARTFGLNYRFTYSWRETLRFLLSQDTTLSEDLLTHNS